MKTFTMQDYESMTPEAQVRFLEAIYSDDFEMAETVIDELPKPRAFDAVSLVTWTAVGLAAIACVGLALWIGGQL